MLKYFCLLICILGLPLSASAIDGLKTVQRFHLADDNVLFYDTTKAYISIKYADAESIVISSPDMCGHPVVSPDRTKVAFLDPWEFEVISDIKILDLATRKITELNFEDKLPFQHTPMRLTWLNDEIMLIVTGYGYGTVTRGGNVYYYRLKDGRFAKLINADRVEITDVKVTPAGLELTILNPIYQFIANRYAFELPRLVVHEFLPMEDVLELMQTGLSAQYHELTHDAATNRAVCFAMWLRANMRL